MADNFEHWKKLDIGFVNIAGCGEHADEFVDVVHSKGASHVASALRTRVQLPLNWTTMSARSYFDLELM